MFTQDEQISELIVNEWKSEEGETENKEIKRWTSVCLLFCLSELGESGSELKTL